VCGHGGPGVPYCWGSERIGLRLRGERMTVSLSGQNALDERVQQHAFGGILSRKVTCQIRFER
jgi:hypothetical protein